MPGQIEINRAAAAYIEELFGQGGPSPEPRVPQIAITPAIGKFLRLLVKISHARRVLEIGTLGGYSTGWLAGGLPPDGELITLEIDSNYASIARENLPPQATLIEGPALQTMKTLEGPFDLLFLDAHNQDYPDYLEPMLALSRPGTLLIIDNVIRRGKVINPKPDDPTANGTARLNHLLATDPRLESVITPTLVGPQGGHLDGIAIARVASK